MAKHHLVVDKNNKAKAALIKAAVLSGRGWKYKHETSKAAIKYKTSGGLGPADLKWNKAGQAVSKAKSAEGKRLYELGYGAPPFEKRIY